MHNNKYFHHPSFSSVAHRLELDSAFGKRQIIMNIIK